MTPFMNTNGDNVTVIKYQMSWPSPGDPYYTPEGGVRRTYYGVSAVPMLFVEGKNVSTSTGAVNAAYTAAMADPAFVAITGTHSINGNNFSVSGQVTPYASLSNVTLHVVIIENLTTQNVGNNGETSFKHVMMKMMPDAGGTTLSMESGVATPFSFSYDMSTTHVEEMDDLVAVIFVQDNSTKYVFQSAYSQLAGSVAAVVSFDPVPGTTGLTTEADLHISFDMPVALVGGGEITNDNVASLITLKKVDGDNFPFTATINDIKTLITVDPTGLLDSYTTYELGIAEVQNSTAIVTPAASTTFQTGMHVGVNEITAGFIGINPNPAVNEVNVAYFVSANSKVEVALLDLSGRLVEVIQHETVAAGQQNVQFGLTDIANGTYIIRLKTNETVKTTKLVINR